MLRKRGFIMVNKILWKICFHKVDKIPFIPNRIMKSFFPNLLVDKF
jgi:hypothetical protein